MHVWIVDGDRSTYESLLAELSSVQWFPDAESFLAGLDGDEEPGVVVADAKLPGMSGTELIDALRARRHAPPVVLVCANAEVSTAVEAIRRGAADFFEKPVPRSLLLGCIRRLLENRQADLQAKT